VLGATKFSSQALSLPRFSTSRSVCSTEKHLYSEIFLSFLFETCFSKWYWRLFGKYSENRRPVQPCFQTRGDTLGYVK
jgi:hypothetical protein